ncbi:MAG TPA: lipase family protein [Desertimonas sp.]|nr:lipase family protein [Desertimonas sp.]
MRKRRTFGVLAIVGAVAIPATAHATELTSADTGAALPGPVEYSQDDPTFYEAPNPIPAGEHGDLVRWQVLESSFDRLYRIMYLSQTVAGAPTVVTGLVSVPDDIAPFGGFRKLLYGHGTTGMADSCAPSMAIDNDSAYGDYDGEFHSVSGTAGDAWVTVATDYEGVGGPGPHPFIVGVSEGRSMLDAGRAAGQIPGVYLSDTTAITGFSQGGHAALWATKLAAEWAPEQTIVGTVVGAPASDPAALASWAASQPQLSALSVGLVAGMATTYPEAQGALGQVLTPAGIALTEAWNTTHCFDQPVDIAGPYIAADPGTVEPFASLLAANTAGTTATGAPMLIFHGDADERIPVVHSEALLARLCAAGQVVERRVLPGGFHVNSGITLDALNWLNGVADGTTTPVSSC